MKSTPAQVFMILNIAGLSLMFVNWLQVVDTEGFLLLLFLAVMLMVRKNDYPLLKKTIFIDLFVTVIFLLVLDSSTAESALNFLIFQSMFLGIYPIGLLVCYHLFNTEFSSLLLTVSVTIIGLTLNFWKNEFHYRLKQRDYFSKKNYDLESLQNELTTALFQVEQMSIVAERSRIASEIHDNAGHEIVAAYITFQTVRKVMEKNPEKALELFDKSMNRLNAGVGKMRDAVHNMSAVTFMGVDRIREICENHPKIPIKFTTSGDMTHVSINIWHVLESVLNESLTNVMKHSNAAFIRVELDATKHLIRLLIENDGVTSMNSSPGSGLRNLRYRVVTIGGNLTLDINETFKVVCVIPIN